MKSYIVKRTGEDIYLEFNRYIYEGRDYGGENEKAILLKQPNDTLRDGDWVYIADNGKIYHINNLISDELFHAYDRLRRDPDNPNRLRMPWDMSPDEIAEYEVNRMEWEAYMEEPLYAKDDKEEAEFLKERDN